MEWDVAQGEPTAPSEAQVRRRRRRDGFLALSAAAPLLGQRLVRAARDRDPWEAGEVAVVALAGVVRVELRARGAPAAQRAADRRRRERREAIAAAQERGEDPYAASNEFARRDGFSTLPLAASLLLGVAWQVWRHRR